MPGTIFNIAKLSSSTAARGLLVAATGSPGTLLHNPGAANSEEVELVAESLHSADVTLTVQWGGTTTADQIPVKLVPGGGKQLVHKGLLVGNRDIRAFASVASVIVVHGSARRLGAFEDVPDVPGPETIVLTSEWSSAVRTGGAGAKFPTAIEDVVGRTAALNEIRLAARFNVGSLAGKTLAQIEYLTNVGSIDGSVAADTSRLGPYNTDGTGDPEADSNALMFTRCDLSATAYVTGYIGFRTLGPKVIDLTTATSLAQLSDAVAAGQPFSIAIWMDGGGAGLARSVGLDADNGTLPPQLRITTT